MIVKSLTLRCPPDRAFRIFTEQASDWWPPERRHTGDVSSTICMEASGRFFERAPDGTEVELGVVLEFTPPHRLVLDWYPGTGPQQPTRVAVTFDQEGVHTRVTVTHSAGPAGATLFERNALRYDVSWDLVLAALAHHGVSRIDQR